MTAQSTSRAFRVRLNVAILAALLALPAFALAQVNVTDPWVRGTVAPQRVTGAFMKLESATDATLVGAASPMARQVEIHEMTMVNNVMRMRPVSAVPLPAGKEVALKPGSYHVMLMGIERQFKEGDVIPITLTIRGKDGRTQTVEVRAPVRDLTASRTAKPPMQPMQPPRQ